MTEGRPPSSTGPADEPPEGHEPRSEGKPGPGRASKETPPPSGSKETPSVPVSARLSSSPRRARRARGPSRAQQDAWVAGLQAGDEGALREVIQAYGERITAVVSGLLRDRDAVEDVVQATFSKAWFRIASFKGDAGLYTWLYRVAVNASKDYIKGRSRRPAIALDERTAAHIPAGEPHVIEGLERRELRERVRSAIGALPERYRVVLALRELEGMTYEGIAQVVGISLGTVESRLFRARRRLRGLLERDLGGPHGHSGGSRKKGERP